MGELIDKIKGKAKQVQGAITGNRTRQAEGVIDEMKGNAKGAFEDAKVDVKRAVKGARSPRNPGPAGAPR